MYGEILFSKNHFHSGIENPISKFRDQLAKHLIILGTNTVIFPNFLTCVEATLNWRFHNWRYFILDHKYVHFQHIDSQPTLYFHGFSPIMEIIQVYVKPIICSLTQTFTLSAYGSSTYIIFPWFFSNNGNNSYLH